MKSLVILLIVIALSVFVGAESCSLDISLLNQDPYPALPGEYVKLVFQVDGASNPECKNVYFELVDDFPIGFDPGSGKSVILSPGNYISDFSGVALLPFKVIINESAVDGDNSMWIKYAVDYLGSQNAQFMKRFDLTVNNTLVDFEINLKDYDDNTQIATFEIINVGKDGVESLTVDLPRQENFDVKGSTRSIIGGLEAYDDSSFTFEGVPKDGSISLTIKYNDRTRIRRELMKEVYFDSSLFSNRVKDIKKTNYNGYVVLFVILIFVVVWAIARARRRRRIEKMQMLALRRK